MSRQQHCPLKSHSAMIGKHEPTQLRRTGPGWFLNWSAIRHSKAQPSSPFCANDILIAIDRHRYARYNAIFSSGAYCMVETREVMFAQQHLPGERGQSDFTHMEDLGITIGGVPFPHMVHHFVLTYSNVEAVSVCFSESFEALAEGIEKALWQIGGVPQQHRTDHLTAAVKNAGKQQARDWTSRYDALMAHYGMQPT